MMEELNRRSFIKDTATAAAGIVLLPTIPLATSAKVVYEPAADIPAKLIETKIKFSVIGINHTHIYGMIEAITHGGGQFVSFYAKEADLVAAFVKKYPQAKLAKS